MADTKTTATMNNTKGEDTLGVLRQLQSKVESLSGVVDTVSRGLDKMQDTLVSHDSPYFENLSYALSSSMRETELDRRSYEEAMRQNEEARKLSSRSPERGDLDFWEKAFAPEPKSASDIQTTAIKAAFRDGDMQKVLKDTLSSATISDALKSDADDRTFGEKALDALGLGIINQGKRWFADRDIRKEEKATKKDQGIIKRENRELERLKAKYRKAGTDERRTELLDEMHGHQEQMWEAERRIDSRTRDPYADLLEKEGSIFGRTPDGLGDLKDSFARQYKLDTQLRPEFYQKWTEFFTKANATWPGSANTNASIPGIANHEDNTNIGDTIASINESTAKVRDDTAYSKISEFIGDPKAAHDIQYKLDTQLRPDFYREGTEFFKKANSGDLFDDIKSALSGLGRSLGKGSLYAGLAVAAAASLGKIVEAGKGFVDLVNSSGEAEKNITENVEKNNEALGKYDKGWNTERVKAQQAENEARAESDLEDASITGQLDQFAEGALGWLGWKSGKTKAEEKLRLAQSNTRLQRAKERRFKKEAAAAGIDLNDSDAMTRAREEFDSRGKLAAGNLEERSAPTVDLPGTSVDPSKVETAEEQAKRIEESTYSGTKRALMDNDVQKQNVENAKIQGQQINESLVGRK